MSILVNKIYDRSKKLCAWLSVESEKGVTAVEYGLIAALVAVAIIVGATALGNSLNNMFHGIANVVTAKVPAAP
jgi:pilus assembly protein Flp/PilA